MAFRVRPVFCSGIWSPLYRLHNVNRQGEQFILQDNISGVNSGAKVHFFSIFQSKQKILGNNRHLSLFILVYFFGVGKQGRLKGKLKISPIVEQIGISALFYNRQRRCRRQVRYAQFHFSSVI